MDGAGPGEAGVLAWCNSIRLTMARDAGREVLDVQIQKQGFDFLESYLDNVFSRAKEEPVYELLKTPGKKKDAPKRTRAATAAVAKLKAMNSIMFEDATGELPAAPRSASSSQENDQASSNNNAPHVVKKKASKVVTIADSPEKMDVDAQQGAVTEVVAAPIFAKRSPPAPATLSPKSAAPHSLSPPPPPQQQKKFSPTHAPPTVPSPEPEVAAVQEMEPEPEDTHTEHIIRHDSVKELSMIAEDEEPGDQSRLSPVRPPAEPAIEEHMEEDQEVPIRDVPHDPMDEDLAVPLRDEPGPSLKRKPSVSQFSGLPAPSPLRKSMRMSHEPSGAAAAPAHAHTPGTGLAGAGKRTSWLAKAKEAKALEVTGSGKRLGTKSDMPSSTSLANIFSGAHAATGTARDTSANRPKSGETLGLGFTFPTAEPLATEKADKTTDDGATESEALAFIKGKRKATSLEDGSSNAVPQPKPQTPPEPARAPVAPSHTYDDMDDMTVPITDPDAEEYTLHRLKMTVKGARAGKSMGKSLGGNAAAELAEARKAAEARLAQRNKVEGGETNGDEEQPAEESAEEVKEPSPVQASSQPRSSKAKAPSPPQDDPSRRMSVSDLKTIFDQPQEKASVKRASPSNTKNTPVVADLSTSTTPPHSPPPALAKAATKNPAPVFSKPPPVFVAPPTRQPSAQPAAAAPPKGPAFSLPVAHPFSLPATSLGVPAKLPSPTSPKTKAAPALESQSSVGSGFSDSVFDKADAAPSWMATQDTAASAGASQAAAGGAADDDEDMDDDSWHVDAQFQAGAMWTPFGFGAPADDTMTWSTLPSGGDTGSVRVPPQGTVDLAEEAHRAANEMLREEVRAREEKQAVEEVGEEDGQEEAREEEGPGGDDMEIDDEYVGGGVDTDLEDIVAAGKATISLVKQQPRAPSQQSMASTSSSQSQQGLFSQAGKLVSSMLGMSKSKKPEPVKSIARAAAAAKKQQEEADKKAARMKEMENRRQLAQQRKADEEKARVQEEEKKAKEEADRRKREREENTDKRPLKPAKAEEDTTKKRKINVDAGKKTESTKPPSKDGQSSRNIKPPSTTNTSLAASKSSTALKSTLSKQASTTSLNTAAGASSSKTQASEKTTKVGPPPSHTKLASAKGKAKAADKDDEQPSKVLQGQMANRAKAQMQAQTPARAPPPVASESIELPDINSEYSDSDDESRPRTFDPPEWAQSPELRQQLEHQSRMNPDAIFGPIGPLRMEEIFRTRQSRFRARTSSANWAGADQLTAEEEREYARRMGFNR